MAAPTLFKNITSRSNGWMVVGLGLFICWFEAIGAPTQANLAQGSGPKPSINVATAPNDGPKKTESRAVPMAKPEWADLTPAQQLALKPLHDNWRFLSETSKRKWIALSMNFQAMAVAEQSKLHGRMNEWVSLSQQQRSQARLNYAQSKQLPQSHKTATWQAYQALSPAEKQELALAEKQKKTSGPSLRASNIQPKLESASKAMQKSKPDAGLVSASLVVDNNTLLLLSPSMLDTPTRH